MSGSHWGGTTSSLRRCSGIRYSMSVGLTSSLCLLSAVADSLFAKRTGNSWSSAVGDDKRVGKFIFGGLEAYLDGVEVSTELVDGSPHSGERVRWPKFGEMGEGDCSFHSGCGRHWPYHPLLTGGKANLLVMGVGFQSPIGSINCDITKALLRGEFSTSERLMAPLDDTSPITSVAILSLMEWGGSTALLVLLCGGPPKNR